MSAEYAEPDIGGSPGMRSPALRRRVSPLRARSPARSVSKPYPLSLRAAEAPGTPSSVGDERRAGGAADFGL